MHVSFFNPWWNQSHLSMETLLGMAIIIAITGWFAHHLETWNTPGYLFLIFQVLENLEKWGFLRHLVRLVYTLNFSVCSLLVVRC
jgi:hypothetical protein